MIGPVIYLLCALTCSLCAALLLRSYRRQRTKLLFWSGMSFCAFGLGNILLFVDFVVVPSVDLSLIRNVITLGGILLLLRGLIWEGPSP
ncbi:MAG TPA: DUF5985 family protein [Lacunisphaera sp.]|nr:DUF5985 family protein [Lacunisphaera sp.]